MTSENPLGNAGYAITGIGGGGQGGQYVFASLDELDSIKTEWTTFRDAIAADRDQLMRAQQEITPPARDEMSKRQVAELATSLTRALEHNDAMFRYADDYVLKLTETLAEYQSTDEQNAVRVRGTDAN